MTQEYLKSILRYNPVTGIWKWKIKANKNINVNDVAGCLDGDGYIEIRYKNILYYAHRLAFLYMDGYVSENYVDHINGVRNDSRWSNLREVSHQCNMRNRKIHVNNTSGIIGVSWREDSKKWRAYITVNRKTKSLGNFKNINDAVKSRYEAELKFNWLECQTNSSAYKYLEERDLL